MYSVNGYRRYSRDVDNAFNIIPSDRISMKGVDFPVIGVDEFGIIQFMQPEKEYQFPGNTVFEVPIKQAGGSHNAQSQTKKPVTQTNDKRDYIAENNVSYQWSDAPINTTPLLIPSAYETTQGGSDSEAAPIQEQLRLVKLALETKDSAYEDQLRALYNTTPHQVLYKYDEDYRNRMDYNASQNPYKIQYPKTDLRRGDNIPPNTAWMYPNLTGQIGAAMTTQANQDLAFDIMGAGMASKYFKGAKRVNNIAKVFKPAKGVDDITENLKHLEYAKNYYSKYGYNIPENLAEIAKNSKLTDETIQGLVNQHNTFVRGVSTNWDEIAKKNPDILRHLEGKGIDYINNPQAAAEYMSTHVPIQTGYGRVGLNENVFREGKDAIYTSNSIPTAEGYTYGDGYIVKVKRPTDFSSKNRIDWINNNKLDYFEDGLKTAPKEIKDKFLKLTEERYIKEIEPKYFDKNGNWKNGKVLQRDLDYDNWKMEQEVRQQLGLPVEKQHNLLKTEHSNKSYLEQINNDMLTCEQFLDRIGVPGSTKKMTEITKKVGKKYNPKLIKLEEEIFDIRRKYPKDNVTKKRFGLNDSKIEAKYNDLLHKLKSTREELILKVKQQQLKYLKDNYGDKLNEVDRYAHYLHIGTPGQKLLEPIEAIRITPDIWKNKSRAHTNVFSKGLSAGSLIPFYLYLQSQNQNKSIADKATGLGKGEKKAFTTIPIGVGTAGTVGASQQKYQQGGTVGMDGMMKARLALDSHFGNSTARRMTNYDTRNYKFDDGSVGNVYVSSYDNLVTPHIQLDENNNLIYVDDVWSDNNKERSYQQSMKFEREKDAEYFGKNYKRVAPMKKLYQDGGYVQEEDPTTQLLYSIAEALQQGSDPREVLNALKQNGVPEEQAMELIKYVMEQMQQQDQLQKEEKQQLEYAQDGKIVRKYNVEDLDWGKGINRAMLAFNMLQTPGLWQAPVKHGVLDTLNAGLGLAAGLSGVGLGYSKLGAKKEYLGAKGLEPMEKLTISKVAQIPEITAKNMTYRPEISTIPLGTKGFEPMKKLTTSEVAQTPEITAKNMTSRPIASAKLLDSGMSFVVDYLPNNFNQLYNAHFGRQLSDFINANSENINTLKNLYQNEDLDTKQDGGYVQEEDPTTQLLYSIAEALQQGSDPREILNALKQNGVPEEQAMELIKYVMEQMQQQDQLQKEEKQQLEYAQDGKIVRKPTSENLTWDWQTQYPDLTAANMTGTNQLVSSVNMTGTNQLVSSPYIPEGKDVTKIVKPSSEFSKQEQTKPEDNIKKEETKQTFYTGDPYGMLMANNALIGFQKFNDYLSDKDYEREYNRRMMQIGNTNAKYNPVNYDNPYGTYTPNVGIGSNYGLVANGPIQDFGTGMFMAEEGGRLPQMPNGGRGIVTDKTVDSDREKTVSISNEKSNKTSGLFGNIAKAGQKLLDEPLIGRTYYFNGKPYLYNPEAREGRKLVFIASDPDNDTKQIDVDIVDFNAALNKDQIINNYYQKRYRSFYSVKPDISKLKLERYYVSDNKENAKSYKAPEFYTFRGSDSEYKVPSLNVEHNVKNNMDRVIQKDGKLYYLFKSFLDDIPYFEEEPQYAKRASDYGFQETIDTDWYKVGFKSVPKVYAYSLDSNYEFTSDGAKIFDENDLRNARLAHNPFAEKEEEIVEEEIVKEEPTNTNKTTTTTQSSSKNNTSGKSTTQKKNDIMYNPKWEHARF